jgi:hypothetical protein
MERVTAMSEEPRPLTSAQRAGVIILTVCAVVLLPATVRFFFLYGHRALEYTGVRSWIAIAILAFATLNAVWAIGMIGATIFFCWKYLVRQRQARLARGVRIEGR